MSKITIAGIDCYGPIRWDSNLIVAGTWADDTEMEIVWCPDISPMRWGDVVTEIKEWADKEGHTIDELTAC